jgi:hypothetical protein
MDKRTIPPQCRAVRYNGLAKIPETGRFQISLPNIFWIPKTRGMLLDVQTIDSVLKQQYEYVDSLDGRIKDSIAEYTGSEFEVLNDHMRRGKSLSSHHQEIRNDLEKAFVNVPPLERPILLFRGVKQEHDMGKLTAFVSVTFDINQTDDFHTKKCCLFIITVSSGSKILPINRLSESFYERELLLPAEGTFFVTNVHYDQSLKVFDLTYIPEKAKPIISDRTMDEFLDRQIQLELQEIKSSSPSLSVQNWVDRLVDLTTEETVDAFGVDDALDLTLDELGRKAPQEAVELARQKLSKMHGV